MNRSGQSRKLSLVEAITNTLIGYAVSIVVQIVVFPLYGATFTIGQNMQLGFIFLVASVIRSYAVRRLFNKGA